MQETFKDYVDRVSRARHMLLHLMTGYDHLSGVAKGCDYAKKYFRNDVHGTHGQKMVSSIEGFAMRLANKAKCRALVVQDKILTYREDEL